MKPWLLYNHGYVLCESFMIQINLTKDIADERVFRIPQKLSLKKYMMFLK